MSEESNVYNSGDQNAPDYNAQPKRKKSKKWLAVLIIIFVVFILPPVLLFALTYDTSLMDITLDETFDAKSFTDTLVYSSLDNVKDTGLLTFSAGESDINNLIYSTYRENEQVKKYLQQFAVDVKDDTYVFNVSAKLGFYQTRARITTKLEKTMIEKTPGVEEEAYAFVVKGADIGKLPVKDLVMFILKRVVSEEMKNTLYDSPLKLNVDLDHSRFYIFTSDLTSIIDSSLGSGSSDYGNFLSSIINDFLNSQLLDLDFYGNESLSANVDLNKIAGNDYGEGQYVYYPMPYATTTTKLTLGGEQKTLSLDVIRDALVVLLNNGLIQKNQMNDVSEYLFNGYHNNNAPACDLSIIGINNKNTYKGFNLYGSVSIDSMVTSSVSDFEDYNPSMNSFQIASITEKDVNDYLHSQRIFGNKFFLTNEVGNNQYKSSYVAFDNAYLNLTANNAVLSAGLNVNGFETTITMLMDKDATASTGSKLVFDTNQMYFGGTQNGQDRISASDGTKSMIFSTIGGSVNCDSFSFSADGKLTIDFTSLINQATNLIGASEYEYKDFLLHNARCDVSVEGNSIADNSVIKIVANRI